jgi:hypothetical protein
MSTYDPHALRMLATRARAEAETASAAGDLIGAGHWGNVADKANQRLSAGRCQAKGCPHRGGCPFHHAGWWGTKT